ncbi:hypothetical protein [Streptomyces palmae]|uniref:Uncharacterized protein n=1 Tax=Streptomyces palmae TaxID=1701085 RepID=A0A4Z0HDI1_9ACTN|nr:hypothetical protein [Streptomyces palmae]TGB14975.1 hypothetical protein E4099_07430 [Streptomyces palmae]
MTTWQLGRVPGRPLRRDGDEHLVLPLWIAREGEVIGTSELALTTAEAEQLHAALCYALDGKPVPDFAPECRFSTQRGSNARR